jgi:choline kinase
MKAIILAAGIASRLRPLTDTMPKCLLQIGQRCLLQRAFDGLIANGISEFVVVTGYRHEQIEDFLGAHYPDQNIHFIYNEVFASTNNIYSLWLTRSETEGQDILLLDSDILFDPRIVSRVLASEKPDVFGHHPLEAVVMIYHPVAPVKIITLHHAAHRFLHSFQCKKLPAQQRYP